LAKYFCSGLLTSVNVPDAQLENDRDLIRFRASQVKEQTRIKQQILSFLLRKGIVYPDDPGWTYKFENWLSILEMESQQDRTMLHKYLNHYKYQKKFVQELSSDIEALSKTERYNDMVTILRGFRGIETLTAMIILTHVPDFRAFPGARKFMSFIGVVPGEHSSGDTKSMRGITKTGSNQLRKAFVSIGMHYNKSPDKVSNGLRLRRSKLDSVSLSLVQRADRRCRKKYFSLSTKNKHNNIIKTAVAREMAGFVWEAMMYYYQGELKKAV
jgi:transposase